LGIRSDSILEANVTALQDWIKFYETITKPLPVASALFLFASTSFLLFASDSMLAKLGMSHVVGDYGWAVGLGFIIASAWLVVTGLIWLSKRLYLWWSAWRAGEKRRKRLHALAVDERQMLRRYVETEMRNIGFFPVECGVAQALADDGILFKSSVEGAEPLVLYSIHDGVLAYLTKNRALVADMVSSETRWLAAPKAGGENMKTVGKIILALVLAYAGLMLASLVGGMLAGFLGARLGLSAKTVDSLIWSFPKAIFLGVLVLLYLWSKRRKENIQEPRE
jgi:hypothetical protein